MPDHFFFTDHLWGSSRAPEISCHPVKFWTAARFRALLSVTAGALMIAPNVISKILGVSRVSAVVCCFPVDENPSAIDFDFAGRTYGDEVSAVPVSSYL